MNSKRISMPAVLGSAVALLLPRMRRDFDATGTLEPRTAAAMWSCYACAAALYADAIRRGRPLPRAPRRAAGTVAASGLAMAAAGMGAFDSPGQVTGTEQRALAVRGVYRVSRNPQYVGYVIAGAAGALASRSPLALALTGAYAAVCRWWVPVEERALERQFGEAYLDFASATPRWLGRPRRHDVAVDSARSTLGRKRNGKGG